jgi:hypothetical protein
MVAAEAPQVGFLGAATSFEAEDVIDLEPPVVGAALDATARIRLLDPAAQPDRDRA